MSPSRPYLQSRINELESLVEANWSNRGTLEELERELSRRSTVRARRLHAKVSTRLETKPSTSPSGQGEAIALRSMQASYQSDPGHGGDDPQRNACFETSPLPTCLRRVGVVEWYVARARPFLEQVHPQVLLDTDRASTEWSTADGMTPEVNACFVGPSGVGKSALINALICERFSILPQGGVGPLTATAARIRSCDEPFFGASYHGREYLQWLKDTLATSSPSPPPVDPHPAGSTQLADRFTRLMAGGGQFVHARRSELIDFLSRCLDDSPSQTASPLIDDHESRASTIRARVGLAHNPHPQMICTAGIELPSFLREVRNHVGGFLAPIASNIEIGWKADLLDAGVVLVDLPGLGIANDEYRGVTEHWLQKARTVVLVVDRSGLSESALDILRRNLFFDGLILHAKDPRSMPFSLIIAVTKLDLSADDARNRERSTTGRTVPWIDSYTCCCDAAISLVRSQLRCELNHFTKVRGECVDQRQMDELIAGVRICPVSALEHRRWYDLDPEPDERPRITDVNQTGMASLADVIKEQIAYHRVAAVSPLTGALGDVARGVVRGKLASAHVKEKALALRRELVDLLVLPQ